MRHRVSASLIIHPQQPRRYAMRIYDRDVRLEPYVGASVEAQGDGSFLLTVMLSPEPTKDWVRAFRAYDDKHYAPEKDYRPKFLGTFFIVRAPTNQEELRSRLQSLMDAADHANKEMRHERSVAESLQEQKSQHNTELARRINTVIDEFRNK